MMESQAKLNADLKASLRALIVTLEESDPTFRSRLEKRLEEEKPKIARETPSIDDFIRKILGQPDWGKVLACLALGE